jgi:hypothetical protein
MEARGILVKMPVRLEGSPSADMDPVRTVTYDLRLEGARPEAGLPPSEVTEIDLNALVGSPVRIEHTGRYVCTRCGRPVNRLFSEGFCYPCFRDAPEAAECIVKPELCEAHLGRGRDPQWEQDHHNQPHAVYFARSSALKVGVTRSTQIPTRWIDQGAAWAVVIAEVPYRRLAGQIEVALKDLYTDRTAWQRMLKNELSESPEQLFGALPGELERVRDHLHALDPALDQYLVRLPGVRPLAFRYPVAETPLKVKSVSLAKSPVLESVLQGIRGQYLMFEGGAVLNVRRHSGYVVRVTSPG